MKSTLILLLLGLSILCAGAQDRVNTYTARLRVPDASTGAQATVSNDSDVAAGLRVSPPSDKIAGYRICIFFDNTQNGRQLANEALSTFKEHFPGIPGEVVYTSPTFKTMVGYLLAMNEASMLLGRVREFFPGAVIEHGSEIKIEDLINSSVIAQPTDSLSTQPAAAEEL